MTSKPEVFESQSVCVSNIFLSFLTTEDFYLSLHSIFPLRTIEICNKATAVAVVFVVVKCLQMKNSLHLFVWERITFSPLSLLSLLTIFVRKISGGVCVGVGVKILYFFCEKFSFYLEFWQVEEGSKNAFNFFESNFFVRYVFSKLWKC